MTVRAGRAARLVALWLATAPAWPAWAGSGFAERESDPAALLGAALEAGERGDWRASEARALDAAARSRAAGERALECRAVNALGDALYAQSRFGEAAAAFERARLLAAQVGDPALEALVAKNLGIAQVPLGRRDLAVLWLERALELRPEAEDPDLAVAILGNLGTVYLRLGAPRAAERAYRRALALAVANGRPDQESDLLGRLGQRALALGQAEEARTRFEAALAAAEAAGPGFELPWLEGAAAAFAATGDEAAAAAALDRLLAEHRRRGTAVTVCQALVSRAGFAADRDPESAGAMFREAASMTFPGDSDCLWQARAGLAGHARAAGDFEAARAAYLAAIALAEERRRGLVAEHDRAAFAGRSEKLYRDAVTLLAARGLERGDPEELELAFRLLERSRAAALSQAIADARRSPPSGPPAAPSERVEWLEAEIGRLRHDLVEPALAVERESELARELLVREAELDENLRNVRRARRAPDDPSPFASATVAAVRAALPADAALVSFLLGEEESFAFLVTAEELRLVPLAARRPEVSDRVRGLLDLLADPDPRAASRVAARLERDLVAPWRRGLPTGVRQLVVVPDGDLASLPFELLPIDDGGRLLVEELAIAYAPSVVVLSSRAAAAGSPPSSSMVIGDPWPAAPGARRPAAEALARSLYEEDGHDLPELPYGRLEAERVRELLGDGSLLAGRDASEARLRATELGSFAVLHFATHGLLSPADPGRSALRLGADAGGRDDGYLQAREIENLRLRAELVVLAACHTARGEALAGSGVESLATAFFRAGARSVVGTLWEVGDRPAERLMTGFYRHLAAGRSKIAALRAAKLEIAAAGRPPREWAGFVLLGEAFGPVPIASAASGGRGLAGAAGLAAVAAAALAWGVVARSRRSRPVLPPD